MTDCVNVCGTGGWSGPLPGDPDNSILLSAVPAFGGIDVSWTYPVINPFAVAHVLLHRGISANFNSSRLLQIVSGNFFYDKLDAGSTYFYWIQIVSVNGTLGDIIGPASATARPLIADLIEQLTGQIDAGLLAQSLKGTIDNISLVSSSLAAEIFDRQTGETSFAQALEDVQAGVAQANTFIATEIDSRISANSAIAEQISLVSATLGGSIAAVSTQLTAQATATEANAAQITQVATSLGNNINAVSTSMTVDVDSVRGTVNSMYTAKVTANGLVGGFGLANNGDSVEAGFDVDTFWVGRTGNDKRKPFIIKDDEVFINQAVINELTFTKLRDESGSVMVKPDPQTGKSKLKADYIDTNSIVITGQTIAGKMVITGNTITVYDAAGTVRVKMGNLS